MINDLSICVNVKDRSRGFCSGRSLTLFPNCVGSLVSSIRSAGVVFEHIELSVVDWQSTDWPILEWIEDAAAGAMDVVVTTLNGVFSRGEGRNKAAEAARYDNLFFLDADMLVPARVLREGMECLAKHWAYFPMPWEYLNQGHTRSQHMPGGTGNSFVIRDHWEAAGKFPQRTTWGHEDLQFLAAIERVTSVCRPQVPELLHQWHPNSWRVRHGTDNDSTVSTIDDLAP
jgi:glycosyltransferase involved in cell wall biosynthesis